MFICFANDECKCRYFSSLSKSSCSHWAQNTGLPCAFLADWVVLWWADRILPALALHGSPDSFTCALTEITSIPSSSVITDFSFPSKKLFHTCRRRIKVHWLSFSSQYEKLYKHPALRCHNRFFLTLVISKALWRTDSEVNSIVHFFCPTNFKLCLKLLGGFWFVLLVLLFSLVFCLCLVCLFFFFFFF